MNELYLLQDGLGNGNYYVVAVGSNSRTAQSNEVEVSDIMASIEITGIKIVDTINIEVSVTAKDFNAGSPLKAFLACGQEFNTMLTVATQIYPSMPVVYITQSITSYKLTIQPWTKEGYSAGNIGDYTSDFMIYAFCQDEHAEYNITENPPDSIPEFGLTITRYDKEANIAYFTAINTDAPIDQRDIRVYGTSQAGIAGTYNGNPTSPEYLKDIVGNSGGIFNPGLAVSMNKDGDYYLWAVIPRISAESSINAFCLFMSRLGDTFVIDPYVFYTLLRLKKTVSGLSAGPSNTYIGAQLSETFTIKFTLDTPVLTYAASDRKLQWENVDGATSYDVYRDGEKVGSVSPSGEYTPVAKISTRTPLAVEMKPAGKPIEVEGKTIGYVDDKGSFTPVEKV